MREDRVRFAGGAEGIYGVIDKPDFVAIVPIHDSGKIELVEQFRYPVGERLWELPLGSWPADSSATPEAVARGELAEETGLTATSWEHAGRLHAAAGVINQRCDLFVATGLTRGMPRREPQEADMVAASFSPAEIIALIESGRMTDAISIAALGLLRFRGRL